MSEMKKEYLTKFYDKDNNCILKVLTKKLFNNPKFLSVEIMINIILKNSSIPVKDIEVFEDLDNGLDFIGIDNFKKLKFLCGFKNLH